VVLSLLLFVYFLLNGIFYISWESYQPVLLIRDILLLSKEDIIILFNELGSIFMVIIKICVHILILKIHLVSCDA